MGGETNLDQEQATTLTLEIQTDCTTPIISPTIEIEYRPLSVFETEPNSDGIGLARSKKFFTHATAEGAFRSQTLFGAHHFQSWIGDGILHCESYSQTRRRLDYHLKHPPEPHYKIPRLSQRADGGVCCDMSGVKVERFISEPAFFATPIEPANWGMWVLQAIPAAYRYLKYHEGKYFIVFSPFPWQKALLSALGVPRERIVEQKLWHTYECAELWAVQYSSVDLAVTGYEHEAFEWVKEIALREEGVRQPPPERVYVSRRSTGPKRALVNEPEIERIFEDRGYIIVEPQKMTLLEQVRLFAQAKAVAGCGGAGLFNSVFCKPGTKLLSLDGTTAFTHNHSRMFASAGLQYAFVLGSPEQPEAFPHSPWHVNKDLIHAAIDLIES